jgi:tetratricopeptide (TPR) repeat protein
MRKQSFKTLGITVVAAAALTACDGLGKLVKNADKITYKVVPEVLEVKGDSIAFVIKGTYPEKMFPKKATVTSTPVLKYNGGEKTFKPVTLIGEQVEGKGTKITNEKGGSFSYTSNKIAYTPEMKQATLDLRTEGQVKSKTKALPEKKVADGVIATPLLVVSDDKALAAKDAFTKEVQRSQTANVFFLINESNVRSSELSAESMAKFKDFVKDALAKGSVFKGINVSAYASPDGELSINTNLAEQRAATATKAMITLFKDKNTKLDTGAMESFYTKVTTAEDWEGFKAAMEASSIADKDLILRVLTMYPDGETREKEIKNLSATYTEVAERILPQLRRAVLTLAVVEKSRTDEEIAKLAVSNPSVLSVEELLYIASLTEDGNAKLQIYKKAEELYASDWRTANNVGYAYLLQNQVGDAEAAFMRAGAIDSTNLIVKNNLGIVARRKGNRAEAMALFSAATSVGPEATYNMGIIELQNGNYPAAVTNFGESNTINAGLAKLLNGTPDDAITTIDISNDKEAALAYYLKAVAGARKGAVDVVITNLKAAIEKDASYKSMASTDAEFLKLKENTDFKAVIN